MTDQKQPIIDRINERWRLHERRYEAPGPEGRCLAFVIDRRYLADEDGIETRLAVSFGDNPVHPETEQSFLPIPALPSKFVFGLHLVGTKGNKLAMLDQWQDTREAAADCIDAVKGERAARSVLESISDVEYLALVSEDPGGTLKVSSLPPLEEFELVEGEDLQGHRAQGKAASSQPRDHYTDRFPGPLALRRIAVPSN